MYRRPRFAVLLSASWAFAGLLAGALGEVAGMMERRGVD